MALTNTWTGSTSGDFNVGANWSSGTSPATGESWGALTGSVSMTSNLSQTGETYTKVTIGPQYTGSINGLVCGITELDFAGGGTTYGITMETATARIFLRGGSANTTLTLTAASSLTLPDVWAFGGSGSVVFADDGVNSWTITNLSMLQGAESLTITGPTVGTASQTCHVHAGKLKVPGRLDDINVYGSGYVQPQPNVNYLTTNVSISGYGRYVHQTDTGIALVRCNGPGGFFDGTQLGNVDVTITDLQIGKGGLVDFQSKQGVWTHTRVRNLGGVLKPQNLQA